MFEYLFQRPKKNFSNSSEVWYKNMVVGECPLGEKIKKVSREVILYKPHTNHFIGVTPVTMLDKCGFKARHGNRWAQKQRKYSKATLEPKMSEMHVRKHLLSPVLNLLLHVLQNTQMVNEQTFHFYNCNMNIHEFFFFFSVCYSCCQEK